MDITRKNVARKRWLYRTLFAVAAAAILMGITIIISNLKRAAPVVKADTVWTATVKQGEMLRQVRGNGTLVPAEVWWIPAPVEGRVERIFFDPGESVNAETVLLELSNPVLERDVLDAKWELGAAIAGLKNLEIELSNRQLEQEERLAIVEGNLKVVKLQAELDQRLFDEELLNQHKLAVSLARLEALENQVSLMNQRLGKTQQNRQAQLDVGQARIEQYRALVALRRTQRDALKVKAGTDGVLQQLTVEVGQQVTTATTLAKVAKPDELKAELRISETQIRDIQVGQVVNIDTRNGIVEGRVARINPVVVSGTVRVEVRLVGALPKGARPELSVEGTVVIDRLENVLHVDRPVGSRSNTLISLFKLDSNSDLAIRTPVKLGRGSVSMIEIIDGLSRGDRIIISDMSKWEDVDTVRLE